MTIYYVFFTDSLTFTKHLGRKFGTVAILNNKLYLYSFPIASYYTFRFDFLELDCYCVMCAEIVHNNLYHFGIDFLYNWAGWVHWITACTAVTIVVHAQRKLVIRLHQFSLIG